MDRASATDARALSSPIAPVKPRKPVSGDLIATISLVIAILAGVLWVQKIREDAREQKREELEAKVRVQLGSTEDRAKIETGKMLGQEIDEFRRKTDEEGSKDRGR